jgi:hypothetical protein
VEISSTSGVGFEPIPQISNSFRNPLEFRKRNSNKREAQTASFWKRGLLNEKINQVANHAVGLFISP